MAQAIFYALNGFVILAILASLSFWIRRLVTRYVGSAAPTPLVPLTPRETPRWTVGEFILMFGLLIVCFAAIDFAFVQLGWKQPAAAMADAVETTQAPDAPAVDPTSDTANAEPDDPVKAATGPSMLPVLAINSLAGMMAMGITMLWLTFVTRCSFSHLGLTANWRDTMLGMRGAFWFIPPVLVISMLASQLVAYEHPVLDTLAANKMLGTWAMLFLSTAVIAPVVEEFMFRVMLQGGLQRLADPLLEPASLSDASSNDAARATWQPQAFWPIVVTSIVFAMMHVGQGAAYIPLFFLSLGLGYLYRQNGSIWPPLIVHVILNSLTMAVEFSRVAAGIEPAGL